MFKPTSANSPNTGNSTAAAFNAYLDDRTQRNPQIQQQMNLAAILFEQQQQRPSSAHSSLLMHQQPQMQPLSSRKLFIGGLGQINDDGLRQYYSQWGQVVDCIVIRDPVTRSSRGFGFVTYATAEMADAAIANRPHIINGKAVDAKRAVPREKMNLIVENDQPPIFLSLNTTPGCRLQLSGLNWEWHTLDTLRTHFEQFGTVEQLEMVAYPRGYGSLSFENLEAVERCMAIGPVHNVNGHPVEIKIASADSLVFHPKEKDQFGGGGPHPNSRPNSSSGSIGANSEKHSRQPQNEKENSDSPPIRPASSDGSLATSN